MTIFFVHRGNPFYLKYAIAQVVSVMPNDRVILLGDETNQNILKNKIEWYPIKSYWETAKSFETVYVHLSPNSKEFELFCYQRWMVVYDWINSHQLEGQMACLDSDVLVFENLSTILDAKKVDLATTKEIGPAFTLFRNQEVFSQFIGHIFESYSNPESFSQLKDIFYHGNTPFFLKHQYVSDMHLLGFFSKKVPTLDLSFEYQNGIFDYAFQESEGFDYNPCKRIKSLWYDKTAKKWFGKRDGRKIYFHGLHFQVGTKVFLPNYYKGKFIFGDYWIHELMKLKGMVTTVIKKIIGLC